MGAEITNNLQVGERVRLRDTGRNDDVGIVTELLAGDYARVRWCDVPVCTTHRLYALESAPIQEPLAFLLDSLSDLSVKIDGE